MSKSELVKKPNTLALEEVAKELNVSERTVQNLINRGELERIQMRPTLIKKTSVIRYKARTNKIEAIENVTEVINTHLGQVRKYIKYNAYLLRDICNVLGIVNVSSVTQVISSENSLLIPSSDCCKNGLTKKSCGHRLITLDGVKEYLGSYQRKEDKERFIQELSGADANNEEKNTTLEDKAEAKEEIVVLDQRELFGKQFKIYGTYEKPLFLAKDVAEMIEHSNARMLLQGIDTLEKVCVNNPYALKGQQTQWFLTEEGLYEALMQSRKPIAKEFKTKVKEILKTIRTTGGYVATNQEERFVNNYFNELPKATKEIMISAIKNRNTSLESKKQEFKNEIYKIEIEQHDNNVAINKLLEEWG